MRVVYLTPALRDLENLREYLGARSPSGLAHVIADIIQTVEGIPGSVARGRKTPRDDIWEKVTPKYRFVIPYHIRGNTLYILHVYSSRRRGIDYSALQEILTGIK